MIETGHYILLGAGTGGASYYQNFFVGETRNYNNIEYKFAPFAISGDVSTQGAEGGETEIIAPANILIGAKMWESVTNRFLVEIRTVMLLGTPPEEEDGIPTWEEAQTVSIDLQVCDGLSYTDAVPGETDAVAIFALRLASPLNAVSGISPTRRLRDDQVGALPSSGGITF